MLRLYETDNLESVNLEPEKFSIKLVYYKSLHKNRLDYIKFISVSIRKYKRKVYKFINFRSGFLNGQV